MKTQKILKRAVSLMLVFVLMVGIIPNFGTKAEAVSNVNAFTKIASRGYAKVYTLTSSGSTIPYTTKYLSTRGTVSYGASNSSYIDNKTDEIYLYEVGTTSGKNWALVSYPTSSGRVKAYIPLSAITNSANSVSHSYCGKATAKFLCAYRYGFSTNSSYYVDKGDDIYVLKVASTSGVGVQIMYPAGSAWRIGWCKYSDIQAYLKNQNRSTYNDVFASTKGKGYNLSQGKSAQSTTFTKGTFVYVWAYLHDGNGNLYSSYGGGNWNMTLSIYKPDGSLAHSYTYKNSDNNWIGRKLDTVGRWKIVSQITGCLRGTNTQYITVIDAAIPTLVSSQEISSAASKYGISKSSNAYKALESINTKYYDRLSSNKNGTLVFFFEGVGAYSSTNKRMNAMCVVVKSGKIKFIDCYSSTIPDYPFSPQKNEWTDMPTIKSGIYSFTTTNHRDSYAALNVSSASVVRHSSQYNYYSGVSYGINVHRRSSDSIAPSSSSWVNSAGCLLVGVTPNTSSSYSTYAKFIQAVGIVGTSGTASSTYSNYITGKIVIDRTYAKSYLQSIGYSSGAISLLG